MTMCLDSNLTMALYKSFTYLLTYISQVPTRHLLSAITKTRQNHCNLGVSTLQCSHLNIILFSLDPGFNGLNASNSISSGASAGFWLACKGGKGNPFFWHKVTPVLLMAPAACFFRQGDLTDSVRE